MPDTHLLLTGRSLDKMEGIASKAITPKLHASSSFACFSLDLSSFASIEGFAEAVKKCVAGEGLDVIVGNAGLQDTQYRTTQEGFEMTFGSNHLG